MYLSHNSNEEIIAQVRRIAKDEAALGIESILHLREFVRRNLHLSGRHSSVFSYLVDLGYS
jgi:hypothetical protein